MAFDPWKKHPQYAARLKQWERQRDLIEGEDAIKAKTTRYLPALAGQRVSPFAGKDSALEASTQEPNSYDAYLARACLLAATSRTAEALVGMLFRRAPAIEWPESQGGMLKTIGYAGESLEEIMAETADETVGIGRYGLLVDWHPDGIGAPYVAAYRAEAITDWDEGVVAGRLVPTRINLLEKFTAIDEGGKPVEAERMRVLRLVASVADIASDPTLADAAIDDAEIRRAPVYVQQVFERHKGGESRMVSAKVPRLIGGVSLTEIPFVFFGPKGTRADVAKPPLLDLGVVNISHFRNSADLEHGAHFTALPQAWVAGAGFKGDVFIGSAVVWQLDDKDAKAGYLEFTGAGLKFLRELMAEKRSEMAALGARMLEDTAGRAEESGVAREHRTEGDASSLARISMALSEGFTHLLGFLAEILGMSEQEGSVSVKLSREFGTRGMDPQMLTALMAGVQQGHISQQLFFDLVQRGGLVPEGITYEDESERIAEGRPGGPGGDGLMGKPSKKPLPNAAPGDDDDANMQEDPDA